jgi:hypothetical protein
VDVGHGQLHERLRSDPRVVCVEGVNARSLTAQALQQACELALSEVIEVEEDNETQPEAPYSWMRNGGRVDEEYDASYHAKDKDLETFKSERAARAKAREQGTLPVERRRRVEWAGADITPVFDVVTGDLSFISLTLVLPAGAAAGARWQPADAGQAAVRAAARPGGQGRHRARCVVVRGGRAAHPRMLCRNRPGGASVAGQPHQRRRRQP